jgi:hypothetical protein
MIELDGTLNDQQLEQDTLEQSKIQGDKKEERKLKSFKKFRIVEKPKDRKTTSPS